MSGLWRAARDHWRPSAVSARMDAWAARLRPDPRAGTAPVDAARTPEPMDTVAASRRRCRVRVSWWDVHGSRFVTQRCVLKVGHDGQHATPSRGGFDLVWWS